MNMYQIQAWLQTRSSSRNWTILSLMLLCLVLTACQNQPLLGPQAPMAGQRSLFAVYMVGSDLEDDIRPRNGIPDEEELGELSFFGAGSSDLREMAEAFQQLPAAARAQIDFIVAFGGARKQGWQGIKYADAECLIADAQDDYFGNADCYLYVDSGANMGDPDVFADFLTAAQHGSDADQTILTLWNHGSGFLGIGKDWNHDGDELTLSDLKSAFAQAQSQFDMIGFDACLMSSLEVAQVLQPYARYMLASQAVVPGHGWNYVDVITHLALNSEQDLQTHARYMIDSFQETERHRRQTNKTLALLDLQALPAVVEALDRLIGSLDLAFFEPLLQTLRNSQGFGQATREELVLAIDAAHWLQNLALTLPEAQADARQALSALESLIVYQRQDGSNPQANGISLFSLNRNLQDAYTSHEAFSPVWYSFAQAFHLKGTADNMAPVVEEASENLCQSAGVKGHCLSVSDNVGLADINQIFALNRLDGSLQILGRDRLEPEREHSEAYFMPAWNGSWFLLCDGHCLVERSVFPPLYFESFNPLTRTSLYAADAVLNDQPVQFYLEVNEQGQAVQQWAIPYAMHNEQVILSRLHLNLKQGDRLRFYYQIYQPETQQLSWETGPEIHFANLPTWHYSTLADSLIYYLEASDYQGNRTISKAFELAPLQEVNS